MSERLAICGGEPVRREPFPSWPAPGAAEEEALLRVLRSGRWGRSGEGELEEFERRFAEYAGARHALAVTSGTVALRLALMAAGIRTGDEVVVPPYTFLATASAVVECNAVPVFADIQPHTLNMDPGAFERAITARTRAVIPVHFAGLCADMDAINEIAARHGLTVIEDAAHAHGSEHKGRRAGSLGHMGCFSFQWSKNLSAGEGGAITTSDPEFAAAAKSVHDCGRVPGGEWYEHRTLGGNYRMTEFQAALLLAGMGRLEERSARREANAARLSTRLAAIPGVAPQARGPEANRHAYHLFPILYDEEVYGVPREAYVRAVRAEGVPLTEGYVLPLYDQPFLKERAFGPYEGAAGMRERHDCPACERVCASTGTWLYQSALLGEPADTDDIAAAFEKLYERRAELAEWAG